MSAGRPGMVSKCHDWVPGEPLSVSWNNERLFAELGSGVPEETRAEGSRAHRRDVRRAVVGGAWIKAQGCDRGLVGYGAGSQRIERNVHGGSSAVYQRTDVADDSAVLVRAGAHAGRGRNVGDATG